MTLAEHSYSVSRSLQMQIPKKAANIFTARNRIQLKKAAYHYNEDSYSSVRKLKPFCNHHEQVENGKIQLFLYARNKNKPQPRVVKTNHISNKDSNTAKFRLGKNDASRKTVSCYCFVNNSLTLPEFTIQLNAMQKMVKN